MTHITIPDDLAEELDNMKIRISTENGKTRREYWYDLFRRLRQDHITLQKIREQQIEDEELPDPEDDLNSGLVDNMSKRPDIFAPFELDEIEGDLI